MLLDHCREMNNRFLIVDTPRDLHDEPLIRWVGELRDRAGESASYGAIYYPWLMNGDDSFPPSGSVSGMYARTELDNMPFDEEVAAREPAPAGGHPPGRSGPLAIGSSTPTSTRSSRSPRAEWWCRGARTLSRDPRWLHINSRRVASTVAAACRRDSEWVVFEQQRPELWEIVARNVRSRFGRHVECSTLTGIRQAWSTKSYVTRSSILRKCATRVRFTSRC